MTEIDFFKKIWYNIYTKLREESIINFEHPTQVAFYNVENRYYDAGIAYGDEIICMCCGEIIPINKLLKKVVEVEPRVKAVIIPLVWKNLCEEYHLDDAMFDTITGEIIPVWFFKKFLL